MQITMDSLGVYNNSVWIYVQVAIWFFWKVMKRPVVISVISIFGLGKGKSQN